MRLCVCGCIRASSAAVVLARVLWSCACALIALIVLIFLIVLIALIVLILMFSWLKFIKRALVSAASSMEEEEEVERSPDVGDLWLPLAVKEDECFDVSAAPPAAGSAKLSEVAQQGGDCLLPPAVGEQYGHCFLPVTNSARHCGSRTAIRPVWMPSASRESRAVMKRQAFMRY